MLATLDHCQKVVAGELAHLTGELDAAISQQDFGFAYATGIKQDLPRCRVAGVVFKAQTEVEITKRDPAGFAATAHVNDTLSIWKQLAEPRAGLRRGGFLEARGELEWAGSDMDQA